MDTNPSNFNASKFTTDATPLTDEPMRTHYHDHYFKREDHNDPPQPELGDILHLNEQTDFSQTQIPKMSDTLEPEDKSSLKEEPSEPAWTDIIPSEPSKTSSRTDDLSSTSSWPEESSSIPSRTEETPTDLSRTDNQPDESSWTKEDTSSRTDDKSATSPWTEETSSEPSRMDDTPSEPAWTDVIPSEPSRTDETPRTETETEAYSHPSLFSALKDQFVGATKEVFGAVFNEDMQNSGAEQRIHGEKEYEAAVHKSGEVVNA